MNTYSQGRLTFEETLVPGREYTVLSLRPIWAWAIMYGGKDVESRALPTRHRGRVLIHASGHKTSIREDQDLRAEVSFLTGIAKAELPLRFARGAIVGSVEITDCIEHARSKWAVPGQFHWLLQEPRPLAVPVSEVHGKLELWSWKLDRSATV